nr:TIGR01620 family protein [uncultured Gellertiella sp.]
MTDPGDDDRNRAPGAFSLAAEAAKAKPAPDRPRQPQSFSGPVEMTPDSDDPFLAEAANLPATVRPARRRFSLGNVAASAFGILLSLALGIWIDDLIRALFDRSTWLGEIALGVLAVFLLALGAIVIREIAGLWRLDSVLALKADAEEALRVRKPGPARAVLARLIVLFAHRPETARGRASLAATAGDIIDGPHLVALCETELLGPLDATARSLVLDAARRVSVVTAVSPRALVDLAYVLFESVRLIRRIAALYGCRPGTLGMIRLVKDVLSHLAVTGTIAVGDSLVQQVLGHGIASRLSARFGEGVINGLMTARIGIAAMDYCRPLAFHACRRPGIGDFIGDLSPSMSRAKAPSDKA